MERFLADSREGLPDIDLDVESARRLEAYEALFERFGRESAACVSMMETYRARSAIRDVGDAVGLPPPRSTRSRRRSRTSAPARSARRWPSCRSCARPAAAGEWAGCSGIWSSALDGLPRGRRHAPLRRAAVDAALLDRTPVEPTAGEGFPM